MCGNIIYCPELMCLLAQSRWQADFQTFTHVSFSPLHINAVFLRSKVSAAEHLQCSVEAHFKDISSDYCSIVQALLILLWISFFSSRSTIFTSGVFTGNKSIHSQKNPEKSESVCLMIFTDPFCVVEACCRPCYDSMVEILQEKEQSGLRAAKSKRNKRGRVFSFPAPQAKINYRVFSQALAAAMVLPRNTRFMPPAAAGRI